MLFSCCWLLFVCSTENGTQSFACARQALPLGHSSSAALLSFVCSSPLPAYYVEFLVLFLQDHKVSLVLTVASSFITARAFHLNISTSQHPWPWNWSRNSCSVVFAFKETGEGKQIAPLCTTVGYQTNPRVLRGLTHLCLALLMMYLN